MADLTDDIVSNATAPKSMSADGTSATSSPVAELVLADQYVNAKAAMRTRSRGLRFSKIVLGGQVPGVAGQSGGFNGLV